MAHDDRIGLTTLPSADDIVPGYRDARQWIESRLAMSHVVAALLGGEGRYAGGAEVIGDLPDAGTKYPPATLCLYDDTGWAWWFKTVANAAITFIDPDEAAATLYAVIGQYSGVTPAMAEGGPYDVAFYAQATADPAPAHSYAVGAGAVVASAFTTWTPVAKVNITGSLILDGSVTLAKLANLAEDRIIGRQSAGAGVPEAITCTAAGRALLDDATAADQLTTLGAIAKTVADANSILYAVSDDTPAALALAANQIPGRSSAGNIAAKSCTDAGFALLDDATAADQRTTLGLGAWALLTPVRLAKAGYPPSGTWATGDVALDALGALWQCTAGGTPGTWAQLQPGVATAAPAASDFADYGGGAVILEGYRWFETDRRMEWESWFDSGAHYAWQSVREDLLTFPPDVNYTNLATLAATYTTNIILSVDHDYRVIEVTTRADAAATTDVTHYWKASYRYNGADVTDYVIDDEVAQYVTIVPTGTTGRVVTATTQIISFRCTPVNSPGTLLIYLPTARVRYLYK